MVWKKDEASLERSLPCLERGQQKQNRHKERYVASGLLAKCCTIRIFICMQCGILARSLMKRWLFSVWTGREQGDLYTTSHASLYSR